MKIALVHNTYQQPGGEDVVFEQEKRMLENAGQTVVTYCTSNDEINHFSPVERTLLPIRMVWARDSKLAFEKFIAREKPDVVHIHNTFMMISPAIYYACRKYRTPVVQTLHNFRLLCPASGFCRNGRVCEECLEHSLLRSVRHRCYRGSRVATAAVAVMLASHRLLNTWNTSIDRYIALNDFCRQKFISAGLPAEKITVKPNFVDPDPGAGGVSSEYAIFVGRTSTEKGISPLLEAWTRFKLCCPLQIIGDGPNRPAMEMEVRKRGISWITFRGQLRRDQAISAIKRARFLIVPSLSYEVFPMSIVEAFACGTPVLCSRLRGMSDLVEDQRTGLHFTPGDANDIAEKVHWALDHPSELIRMGWEARREFEMRYTAKANYPHLMGIYEQAIASHAES